LSTTVARNIVSWREKHGPFPSRQKLLEVPQLGPRAFEQCAGFLRIPGARNPLDNTAVHPESYPQVEKLSQLLQIAASPELAARARQLPAKDLAAKIGLGEMTFQDVLDALTRPGRDPRDDLPQPTLRSDVLEIKDLKPGMVLQGVVRNVADFGAFVDIGPLAVVKAGQAVKVRVLSVDPARKRISLSMKGFDEPSAGRDRP